ncbi:hypothetical protein CAMSH0001_0865 [Campylobacter showae RM3277]|uniref:Uncharacterized protein n=1 Tax=Campylobacter showae RM3277 TaxID=553219 RepID=C6RHN7_9BACT|nr:hypothetical protein CAMSH0001_0865 [Campylobacter showae RM3277]
MRLRRKAYLSGLNLTAPARLVVWLFCHQIWLKFEAYKIWPSLGWF